MFKNILKFYSYYFIKKITKFSIEPDVVANYCKCTVQYSSLLTILKGFTQFKDTPKQINKYWAYSNNEVLIKTADDLYVEGKFLEVYELLNRLKFSNNAEIQWRICRVLFKMATKHELCYSVRREMIVEGHKLINETINIAPNNSNVCKWMAIFLDLKGEIDGTAERILVAETVKQHLMHAHELNPEDSEVLYLLGYWCYRIASISWFYRQISKFLYTPAPEATYEEALYYFLKAEEVDPRFFLRNLFMIGKTCLALHRYYSANFYLTLTAALPPRNEIEVLCQNKAKILLESIIDYDITKHMMIFDQ